MVQCGYTNLFMTITKLIQYTHQETWNNWHINEKNVKIFLKKNNITLNEYKQFAVFRNLKDRNGWAHNE